MNDPDIFMGKYEGWTAVAKELGMTSEMLRMKVRRKEIKAQELHDRVIVIPPDEQLRLTGKV